jgi:hypothetical protein
MKVKGKTPIRKIEMQMEGKVMKHVKKTAKSEETEERA